MFLYFEERDGELTSPGMSVHLSDTLHAKGCSAPLVETQHIMYKDALGL